MASQQEKTFCVLRFEVSRSVITVHREFCPRFRTAGSAWETWTIGAADGVCCAHVRCEINFLLTLETAPFFCVYPVYVYKIRKNKVIVIKTINVFCVNSMMNKF
jgi:hypothetical protein